MCGAVGCENWLLTFIHLFSINIYMSMSATIDTSITNISGIDIPRSFTYDGAGVSFLLIWKTLYMLNPFVGIILGVDLTLV